MVSGVGQERLGPSYVFIPLVQGVVILTLLLKPYNQLSMELLDLEIAKYQKPNIKRNGDLILCAY